MAAAYNDALDRCTRTQGSTIDDVMEFFADDAVRVTVGQEPAIGKPAVRESFLRRLAQPSKELRAKRPGDSLAQVQDVKIAENSFPTFHGDTLNRFRIDSVRRFRQVQHFLSTEFPNPNWLS